MVLEQKMSYKYLGLELDRLWKWAKVKDRMLEKARKRIAGLCGAGIKQGLSVSAKLPVLPVDLCWSTGARFGEREGGNRVREGEFWAFIERRVGPWFGGSWRMEARDLASISGSWCGWMNREEKSRLNEEE